MATLYKDMIKNGSKTESKIPHTRYHCFGLAFISKPIIKKLYITLYSRMHAWGYPRLQCKLNKQKTLP